MSTLAPRRFCFQGQGGLSGYPKYLGPRRENVNCQDSTPPPTPPPLTPVASDEIQAAEDVIKTLVGQQKIYAFGERTPGRKHLKAGDYICFYATGFGVVGHAKVTSAPEKKPHPSVRHPERYPWVFRLDNAKLYLEKPTIIDAELRPRLDAFRGRDPNKSWAWFVQATRSVTENDFKILVGEKPQVNVR